MHSLMQFLSCVDYVSSSEKVGICDLSFVWIALSGGGGGPHEDSSGHAALQIHLYSPVAAIKLARVCPFSFSTSCH